MNSALLSSSMSRIPFHHASVQHTSSADCRGLSMLPSGAALKLYTIIMKTGLAR